MNIDSFEDCLANAYLELGRAREAIAEFERHPESTRTIHWLIITWPKPTNAKVKGNEHKTNTKNFSGSGTMPDEDIPE